MAKDILKKSDAFYDIYERNPAADKTVTTYCPGCGHGIAHKFIAEALEDFKVYNKSIFLSPVGCSVFGKQKTGKEKDHETDGNFAGLSR